MVDVKIKALALCVDRKSEHKNYFRSAIVITAFISQLADVVLSFNPDV